MKKYQVDYTNYDNRTTSAIDTITAPDDYTAEQYVEDCIKNADTEWAEMVVNGHITLTEVE